LRVLRVAMLNSLLLLRTELEVERLGNLPRSLLLQRKYVFHFSDKIIGPHLEPGGGVDQMNVDAHLVACLAHTSFEQVANAERFSHLGSTLVRSFQRSDRRMRSNIDALNLRELGRNLIGHSIAEIAAVRLGTQVLQRQ